MNKLKSKQKQEGLELIGNLLNFIRTTKMKLRKQNRLRKRREFLNVGKKGRKIILDSFLVIALKNNSEDCRFGITVTKKVGNAPTRNKIKRYVREVVRQHQIPGFDLVFIAKRDAEFSFQQTLKDVESLKKKIKNDRTRIANFSSRPL